MIKEENKIFWNEEGKTAKISHSKLLGFINENGFSKAKINDTNTILVKKTNNRVRIASEEEIKILVQKHLKEYANEEVLETFTKGVGSYVTKCKLELLDQTALIDDRDSKDSSNFFFQNVFCRVTSEGIQILDYSALTSVIWEDKLIKRNFEMPSLSTSGDFEIFCKNISFNNDERFLALKTTLGYLLHRNKEVGESKAIILYDEKMGLNKQAHGGTGKTLLSLALKECRELETFDGKEIKEGSFFKNQRLNLTTDLMVYDDLKANVNFESFFPIITSGIEVEKKGKQSFYIEQDKSPKILISSNYIVKGPGGSSDSRRRHEFEIANYYNEELTPEMEFGSRFFNSDWSQEEWNKFYFFMMTCVMDYLKNGLIKPESINLRKNRMIDQSCPQFIEFAKENITFNKWIDKRNIFQIFQSSYPEIEDLSSHKFTKWIKDYGVSFGSAYEDKSTGGIYLFILNKHEDANGN
ncbi:primase-helicase family protein [Flavobacterium sp. GT3R68]|uniref:primase-helicase family protein n=1 Tax=Flavobacterium sp. GT3R68 TaxID=2594437 RepID=UPI000F86D0AE|nr:primase-helicase family protein [Flavobacterium sp. GT3R68]RTY96042.1 hypothetical protein EKL32_05195 [Flavobacterium sp. GSN2]TRW93815.1 hypothetical protein FNW07_02585 [Flavobacterium sp. GT3R68]